MGVGYRKEQMDWLFTVACVKFVHDEPPESHTFLSPQPEGYGYYHFKTVHVIANPTVLPDMPYRFFFQQLLVFVDSVYSLTDIASEHIERIAHFLLCHPNGSGRHGDRPVFTDCNDPPVHSSYLVLESTFRTLVISRRIELSNTRA